MVAVLKPIEARVLTPPCYDNTNLSRREDWILDNAFRLKEWWDACESQSDEPSRPGDWDAFCWSQWDRQTAIRYEHSNSLRQY